MSDDQPTSDRPSVSERFRRWIDIPSMIGIVLIFLFAVWFVRIYADAIS